jgi:ankyrin repeat protein
MTPLHFACQNGYTKIVLWLLAIPGINIQRANFEKWTPLHSAMQNRHAECVALLLAKGVYKIIEIFKLIIWIAFRLL